MVDERDFSARQQWGPDIMQVLSRSNECARSDEMLAMIVPIQKKDGV